MVVANLKGGLGNQMFQWAAATALANKHGVEAKLDPGFLNQSAQGYTRRDFALDVFRVQALIASPKDIQVFESLKPVRFEKLRKIFSKRNKDLAYYPEKSGGYNSEFENLPSDTYLDGYWQSEKYFLTATDLVRKQFVFSDAVKNIASDNVKAMKGKLCISLHVRRGDFVSNDAALSFHGVCGLDYYEKAVRHMQDKFPDALFYVFSDDMNWCRANLQMPAGTQYVELSDPAAEMYLMSCCSHHIIANSSFSWWAAWLGQNENKVVITPKRWYAKADLNTEDIYCKGWLKM